MADTRPGFGVSSVNRRFMLGASLGLVLLPLLAACNGVANESFDPVRYRLKATMETPRGFAQRL